MHWWTLSENSINSFCRLKHVNYAAYLHMTYCEVSVTIYCSWLVCVHRIITLDTGQPLVKVLHTRERERDLLTFIHCCEDVQLTLNTWLVSGWGLQETEISATLLAHEAREGLCFLTILYCIIVSGAVVTVSGRCTFRVTWERTQRSGSTRCRRHSRWVSLIVR